MESRYTRFSALNKYDFNMRPSGRDMAAKRSEKPIRISAIVGVKVIGACRRREAGSTL
jgi:hypothetical protein